MKQFLLIGALIFTFTFPVEAETKINVSNSTNGGSSSVRVESNSQSSVNNVETKSSETSVRIESNGEVREYHSGEPNTNIVVESNNGNSSVIIDGESVDLNQADGGGKVKGTTDEVGSKETLLEGESENEDQTENKDKFSENMIIKFLQDQFDFILTILNFNFL